MLCCCDMGPSQCVCGMQTAPGGLAYWSLEVVHSSCIQPPTSSPRAPAACAARCQTVSCAVLLRCVSSVVSCSWYYIAYVACIYYSVDVRTTSWVPSAYVVVACPVVALLVSLCLCLCLSLSLSPPLLDLLRHPSSSSIIVHCPCLRLPHTLASPYSVPVPCPL